MSRRAPESGIIILMNTQVLHDNESGVVSYSRSFPIIIDRAIGSVIYDVDNQRYVDFFSGAGANNYGHNPAPMKQALLEYIQHDGINNSLDMATVAKRAFIDTYVEAILRPRGLDYRLQFTGPTGTNAVEAALKLARINKGRSGIFSFHGGFHGVSLGSLSVTSNPYFREAAGVEMKFIHFLDYDQGDEQESIAHLEEQFTAAIQEHGAPAGVIVECIQGEGGVNAARPGWLQTLRRLTKEHDIVLIIDDIQAGCGRSGDYFSFEQSGIVPDVVTQSKSLSGYGSPMSILLVRPELDIWKPAQHNATFRGNNHAFVTARATYDTFWRDDQLMQDVHRKAEIITEALTSIAAAHPEADITLKGRGFFQGLGFKDPAVAAEVSRAAFRRHLIIERSGPQDEVVKLFPALTIDDDTLREGLGILAASVAEACAAS